MKRYKTTLQAQLSLLNSIMLLTFETISFFVLFHGFWYFFFPLITFSSMHSILIACLLCIASVLLTFDNRQIEYTITIFTNIT